MTANAPTYEELGIEADTWACIAVMSLRDAKDYAWRLASAGVPALVSQDGDDPKRWHVAVQGGLRNSPRAWLVSIRPEDAPKCLPGAKGQHPQAPHI